MNNNFKKDVLNFIGRRLAGPTPDAHKKAQEVMYRMIDKIATGLAAANNDSFGKTRDDIYEHIEGVVLAAGCAWQEYGYGVGFADALEISNHLNSARGHF